MTPDKVPQCDNSESQLDACMIYVKTIISSAYTRRAIKRQRSGIRIAPNLEGFPDAVLQRPSKHNMKMIADKADPCVVPCEIGKEEQ